MEPAAERRETNWYGRERAARLPTAMEPAFEGGST